MQIRPLSNVAIGYIERGIQAVDDALLSELAQILNQPVAWFQSGDEG